MPDFKNTETTGNIDENGTDDNVGLTEPAPEDVMRIDPDLLELNGAAGRSFIELRDGETYGEFTERTAANRQRDIAFLWHCYKQSDDNWVEAFRLAPQLTCLGAVCTNGWLDDMDEDDFEDIEDFLPYDDLDDNAGAYVNMVAASPFFAKYSSAYGDTLRHLIDQFPEQGADWALEAIYDEVRKEFGRNRVLGRGHFQALDDAVSREQSDGGSMPAESKVMGIADVGDEWEPISIMGSPVTPVMEQAKQVISDTIGQLIGDDGTEDEDDPTPEFPDDEMLELLWLQAYIWGDRSWSKAEKIVSDFIVGLMSYASVAFAPYPLPGDDVLQAHAERLDELARDLMDEDGNVALRVDETKQPIRNGDTISYPLDEKSNEFVQLMQEQEQVKTVNARNQNTMLFSDNLPACHDNVHGLLAEEVVDYLLDCSDDPVVFERQFNELSKHMSDRAAAIGTQAKSKWKKYLKSNPDAAAAAKHKEVIVQADDDGNPIFIGQVSQADTAAIAAGENGGNVSQS